MKVIKHPHPGNWDEILKRPVMDTRALSETVAAILDDVQANGDAALRKFSREFEKIDLDDFRVSEDEFLEAEATVQGALKDAIRVAKTNIEKFHVIVEPERQIIETTTGVYCWTRSLPIQKVGLYVPAGSAPLFSTVLMLAIPAKLAGCGEIVMCTPPSRNGKVDATTLYAARLCGVTRVYKLGGAQAIAAMAFGTDTVRRVYKIFGPGNQYVTEAKLQVMRTGVAIDMPAGPSEVAVLADDSCVPAFVAADILAQAEHGSDSHAILVTDSRSVIDDVMDALETQIVSLPRREIARSALTNSKAILVESIDAGLDLMNEYAAEHLIIATRDADSVANRVMNAGSVFVGNFSCESAGDYASGTNHTLPTNGAARAFSGVSVASFVKTLTFQKLNEDGIRGLGPTIEVMADAEGLDAHRRAVSIRREYVGS
jgi:histidinol dehydrogenase